MVELERVRYIPYKGRQILYIDYSNLKSSKEVCPVIAKLTEMVHSMSAKQLFLTDATDGSADKDTMAALKRVAQLCKERDVVEKECIVGIKGIKKVLLKAVNTFAKSNIVMFDTQEEAMEWLVA